MILLFFFLLFLVAGTLGFLALTEYRPAEREALAVVGSPADTLAPGASLTVMTWNIGYGALDENADFFMAGGKTVRIKNAGLVRHNLNEILARIKDRQPDILFLQEIDIDSSRSCHINELDLLRSGLRRFMSSFAYNFKVMFVPYPLPPLGKVSSGIATFSRYAASSAERVQLPVPFPWPIRMANLKRCALITRLPVKGCGHELVLMNLHLEAFDTGKGKAAQTERLAKRMDAERKKGNYVIAGGDFNQSFPAADMDAYPVQPGKWAPGKLDTAPFIGSWQFLTDSATPSCRSLHRPYAGADRESFQYYLIDGFIVSDNLTVESFAAWDLGFTVSDHNPVVMRVRLN